MKKLKVPHNFQEFSCCTHSCKERHYQLIPFCRILDQDLIVTERRFIIKSMNVPLLSCLHMFCMIRHELLTDTCSLWLRACLCQCPISEDGVRQIYFKEQILLRSSSINYIFYFLVNPNIFLDEICFCHWKSRIRYYFFNDCWKWRNYNKTISLLNSTTF